MTRRDLDWGLVLDTAREVVESYETPVTLRQLFYRLVSRGLVPNTLSAYKGLSARTAQARRDGDFPALLDRTRMIYRYASWASPATAIYRAYSTYRRDRTEGQKLSLYLGVEKAGMVVQLQSWFGDLGIPVLALGGYASQTYTDDIVTHVERQDRDAVLLYAGDHDPSGHDIDRDLVERTDCWAEVVRIALNADQVEEYDLPPMPGKTTDSRAVKFMERFGELVQVELDALDPDDLRALYQAEIDRFWDTSAYEAVLTREESERDELYDLYTSMLGDDEDEDEDES
jgi:hypothetical protein